MGLSQTPMKLRLHITEGFSLSSTNRQLSLLNGTQALLTTKRKSSVESMTIRPLKIDAIDLSISSKNLPDFIKYSSSLRAGRRSLNVLLNGIDLVGNKSFNTPRQ